MPEAPAPGVEDNHSWDVLHGCTAVGAHPRGVCGLGATRGAAGGCGQAGDRKGSREDLGHHLVASLTAFPKSLSHRVTVLHGREEIRSSQETAQQEKTTAHGPDLHTLKALLGGTVIQIISLRCCSVKHLP